MRKYFLIISISFLLFFCNKKREIINSSITVEDSISYYLKIYSNSLNLSENDKLKLNKKAYKLIKESKVKDKLKKLDFIIDNYFYLNDWTGYDESSKLLLNFSISEKDTLYQAKAQRYRGNFFYSNKILDSSFYHYLNSEKLFYHLGDNKNYAIVLLKKGIVQLDINDFIGADISLKKAYAILKDSEDKDRIYATLNSLGTVSTELKEYDRAIKNYKEAILLVKKENIETDEYRVAICLNNLGLLYNSQENYKKAINYFKEALLEKNIKKNNPELYSIIVDNLAYSKFKSKEYSNLPSLFFESLKVKEDIKDSVSKVLIYIHLSEYYHEFKDSIKSKQYSEGALKIAKVSKNPIYIIRSLKNAAIVDKKRASEYSNRYLELNDSLIEVERNSKDRFARIELETDELRQEKGVLEERNRDILNYLLGTIILGGFLFFIRIQRSRSRELSLKQAQQQANEEIYRLIISHQNQLEEGRDLEKRRISKELHDGVLGRLFGLRLNLDGLNNFDDKETKHQRLKYLNELKVIEQDLREISHELNRENLVLINNFVAIINNLLEQQSKTNPAKIHTIMSEAIDWEKVTNTVKINLYRILQEALQNINKHAEAKNINVNFNKDSKGNLIFSVEDDGKGYNTNNMKMSGIGVNNIVERVHQCQGKIDIKSQIAKGTKIIITFPLENETINI